MNKLVSLQVVNEILKDFESLKKVSDSIPNGYWEERYDGAEVERVTVYETQLEGIYLEVTRSTDSYGDNETLTSLKFVERKEKVVTVYE